MIVITARLQLLEANFGEGAFAMPSSKTPVVTCMRLSSMGERINAHIAEVNTVYM